MNQKWIPAFALKGQGEGDGDEWVMLAETETEREDWVASLNRCRNWKQSFADDYAKKRDAIEQAARYDLFAACCLLLAACCLRLAQLSPAWL